MRAIVCCQPAIAAHTWPEVTDKLDEGIGKLHPEILRLGLHYPTELSLANHFLGRVHKEGDPFIELAVQNTEVDVTWPARMKAEWWHLLDHNRTRLFIWVERPDKATPYVDWFCADADALLVIREKQDTSWFSLYVTIMLALNKTVVQLDPVTLRLSRLKP